MLSQKPYKAYELNPMLSPKLAIASDSASFKVCDRVIGMKDACIHPATNRPYIKSAIGGRDTSPEGYQVQGQCRLRSMHQAVPLMKWCVFSVV